MKTYGLKDQHGNIMSVGNEEEMIVKAMEYDGESTICLLNIDEA